MTFCIVLAFGLSACDGCGGKEEERHTHNYIATVTQPTCTVMGYTSYKCECGRSYDADYTEPLGHDFDGKVCLRCGYELHDHVYTRTIIEPDCENGGYTLGVCDICGATYKAEFKDPLGHDYDNGFCKRCDYFNAEEHEHIYEHSTVEPDCTKQGYTVHNCYCGYSYKDSYVNQIGHSYIQGKCSICGDVKGTKGLEFTLFDKDGSYYICTGIGSAKEKDIIIPPEFKGKPVKEIGRGAFFENKRLTSVTMYDSIIRIGELAFDGCSNLEEVTFGDGLHTISKGAFDYCSSLKSLTIPESVYDIADGAFRSCAVLESITVAQGNTAYYSRDNCIIKRMNNTLVLGCKSSVIPADGSVTVIGNSAFYDCEGLISLTVPGSIKEISSNAFSSCSNLQSVTIQSGVEIISNDAFYRCENLINLTIPDSVTLLGNYAFRYCDKIENVSAPLSVLSGITRSGLKTVVITGGDTIENRLFSNCTNLKSVIIGDSVTSIGNYAFVSCYGLESVTIGKGMTDIGNFAFSYCYALKDIYYNGTQEGWEGISKGILWDNTAGRDTERGTYTLHIG